MRSAACRTTLTMLLWSVCATAMAQAPSILTGTVTTRADGLPVPGAVVSLVGTDVVATTDDQGKYRLELPAALREPDRCRSKSTRLDWRQKSMVWKSTSRPRRR